MTSWFVYIIQNHDGLLYTGITTEPERRLREHNGSIKGARYTKGKGPWKMGYLEPIADRVSALKREHAIKQLRRVKKLELIQSRGYVSVPPGPGNAVGSQPTS